MIAFLEQQNLAFLSRIVAHDASVLFAAHLSARLIYGEPTQEQKQAEQEKARPLLFWPRYVFTPNGMRLPPFAHPKWSKEKP